jgi:hypothetical protein
MAKRKIPKASDVFREGNFLLGPKAPFSEVFPMIETIQIEVEESGQGLGAFGTYGTRKYSLDSGRQYVDCSNSLCYNGGVNVGFTVSSMVREKQTDDKFSKHCQGLTDRRSQKPCMNRFDVAIHLKYKPEPH